MSMQTVSVSSKKSSSSTFSSSSSHSSSSSTAIKQTSSSFSSLATSSSSSKTTKASDGNVISITSSSNNYVDSASKGLGKDLEAEMEKMKLDMGFNMDKIRSEFLHLMPLERDGSADSVMKLDSKSIMDYVDEAHKDKLKFNFDVHELKSESLSVKAVGNKIEVHGKKMIKTDGDEQSEEYSRTYELPSGVNPDSVTSEIYKDGVLTVELPVASIEL